jgi:ATP-dependent RNA helicase DDX27
MTQTQRLAALDDFRTGKVTHLIATDVAARGLDIPSVDAVISFDAPKTLASYLHRVGRTARAGKKGTALTFMEEADRKLVKTIAKRGANLKARIVPGNIVAEWHKKIENMEEQIVQINYEERTERQLQKAEMEANKASNLLEHAAEIKSRPAKTWFQSEREKRNVQKNALKAMETAEMDLMDKGSHKRAGKRKQQASGPDRLPDSKRARRKLAMERFYAKEREGDDGDASRGIRVTKGVKSIKSLEREARLTGGVASKVVRMARNARDPKTKAKRRAAAAADDDDDPRFQSSGRGAGFRGKFRSTGANTNANAKPFKATKGKFKSASKYKRKK